MLAHPERLTEEYRRRLQPETSAKRPPLVTVEGQISQLRQGVARLIDSYAGGLIDKHEFEPRITRLRQRLARLEEQRQHLADEAAMHTELQLIIGRLEDFATKVHDSLEEADWARKRDLIRTLVKRVEVAQDQVNIVFRIDPYLGDPDPEKKACNFVGGVISPLLANVALDGMERLFEAEWPDGRPKAPAFRKGINKGVSVTRYANDFVISAPTREVLETHARPRMVEFLKERGLALNEGKTRIIHMSEGFNFLGFHIKKFGSRVEKLLVVPQKEKVLKAP